MNHYPNAPPPTGDNAPTTPPLPSIQTSPQPQVVLVGSPKYVFIEQSSRKPSPYWLDVCLMISAMVYCLGQFLCIKYAEDHEKVLRGFDFVPKAVIGYFLVGSQMVSDMIGYQLIFLAGLIGLMIFGLIAIYGYEVAGGRRRGGALGWELMFSGVLLSGFEIIVYGLMAIYTTKSMSNAERNMIVYLIGVAGISSIMFVIGWGLTFNKLFSRAPNTAIRIVLHICTLVAGIFGMLAPTFIILSGKTGIGKAGSIIAMILPPIIYGIYTWLVYLKEKRLRNNDLVIDPSRLSVSVEAGKGLESNQPLIIH